MVDSYIYVEICFVGEEWMNTCEGTENVVKPFIFRVPLFIVMSGSSARRTERRNRSVHAST